MDVNDMILIGGAVLVGIIVICVISSAAKKKYKDNEKPASILDVDLSGVPSSSDRTFEYGYEKEDTVIIEPVKEEEKEVVKATTKKPAAKKTTTPKKTAAKKTPAKKTTTTKKTTTKKTATKKEEKK